MADKTVTVEALHGQLAIGQQEPGPVAERGCQVSNTLRAGATLRTALTTV